MLQSAERQLTDASFCNLRMAGLPQSSARPDIIDHEPSPIEQWQATVRTIMGLLVLQTEKPGTTSLEELPDWLRLAADERDRQGDYGAARLLDQWAMLVTQPVNEWDRA